MSLYWLVSIQSSGLLHFVILRSLGQSMPCASIQVRWNCLWMPICVTPVLFLGWSCRWSLLMLVVIGGSTWVSHATLKEFSIAMLWHCRCIPQCHVHMCLTIALLIVWQRLCCWLGTYWLWYVGGISFIVEDLVDAIVGSVAVPIVPLSSVSGIADLRSIVVLLWHVLHDWASQSAIPVYVFEFLLKLMPLLCQWSSLFLSLLVGIFSESECVLCLASCPSPASFLKESGSSCFRGFWWLYWSEECIDDQ